MTVEELTKYINEHIPVTAHLGAKVTFYDGEKLEIHAPLEPNLNHRNTAFGGSLSALAILSAWALLFIKMKEHKLQAQLVIQKSSFDFTEPIEDDFTASCLAPNEADWNKFLTTLNKRGKARIQLDSSIVTAHNEGGNHSGSYVAILQPQSDESS